MGRRCPRASWLFVLDLLVIHPFEDGNGRVGRLLTNAMLSEHGYTVGRYVSLEQSVAESADAYYQALLDSTRWRRVGRRMRPGLAWPTGTIARRYWRFSLVDPPLR